MVTFGAGQAAPQTESRVAGRSAKRAEGLLPNDWESDVRKQISKKLRFEVFKRDKFTCQYCGAHPPDVILQVDHIHPVSKGGTNDQDNLITACQPCNLGKMTTPLSSIPQSLADRAAETAEREEQIKGYEAVMRRARNRLDKDSWVVAEIFIQRFSKDESILRRHRISIKHFINKLGLNVCIEAMELSIAKINNESSCFRYFCGICWSKINGGDR